MAIAVQQIDPVAHLPLVLGVLRRLEVATMIDRLIPPTRDALFAANLNRVFGAIALKALEVYAIPTP